ncbi:phage portal protein [Chromohalobacter sp. TMW 2.2308]|uniref:Phage portal protein n=1 Tax=Chromohalobacter moromii TaxID=2860329 RepID=A0A9X2X3P4_9GAMM|nr:phage portal protein [Chromohalobacter moromii]MCK2042557.1 phage portal protein [Chromohalobacter moromii]MCT8506146.1 phage portal protein [Chromohalobacter moromii]
MFWPGLFTTAAGGHQRKNTDWTGWVSSVTGRQSSAGTMVNTESALAVGALRACVTLLAESVAQLPCELYRRDGDGGRDRAVDHPIYDLVHSQPNRKDTSFEYYEQAQGCLGLEGNHFSLIERDERGYPTELIPIHPKKVRVLKGPDGMPYYHLVEVDEVVPMRMMHHIKAFSVDGYVGLSPIATNSDVIGLGLATEQHAAAVFQRGATMSGVIERPRESEGIKDQAAVDRLLNKFTERHGGGLRNAFSVALLQEGMTYKQLSMDNEKAQLLESRNFSINEVCRLYKVPPHMVQQLDKATFNNIEHQGLQYVIYTLLPWVKRIEAAMMRDLLLPEERKQLYIEFNVGGLLRGDQKSRYESYALGRQWGWLSVNDIRRLENMPPISGGDRYLTPMNMNDSGNIQQSINATPEQMKEIEGIIQCRTP